MGFPKPTLTNAGKQALLKTLAGKTLTFSSIKIGDGKVSKTEDLTKRASLVNLIHSFDIASCKKLDDTIELIATFSNDELNTDFEFREIGAYALEPGTGEEILYCYTNCGEEAEKIEGVNLNFVEKTLKIIVTVNDAENVTITVNPDLNYITRAEFNEVVKENKVTKTSQLENDSNFVTRSDLPDGVDVVDNLKSISSHSALSAYQGKVLNESKVDKEDGKGLSTNDFNDELYSKLSSIYVSDNAGTASDNNLLTKAAIIQLIIQIIGGRIGNLESRLKTLEQKFGNYGEGQ